MKYLSEILKLEEKISTNQSLDNQTDLEIIKNAEILREILSYYNEVLSKLWELYLQCMDSLNPNDNEENPSMDAHVIRCLSQGFCEASGKFWDKQDRYEAMLEEYEFVIAEEIEEEVA